MCELTGVDGCMIKLRRQYAMFHAYAGTKKESKSLKNPSIYTAMLWHHGNHVRGYNRPRESFHCNVVNMVKVKGCVLAITNITLIPFIVT